MNLSWRPTASTATLRARAELMARARAFFAARNLLEIDPPVLQGGANLDHGVAPFRLDTPEGPRWLPTSPEHPLKRLLAAGVGDCWALSPAFRAGERGRWHAPEFRMLEWYRIGWDERRLLTETVELLSALCGGPAACSTTSFADAFRRHAGLPHDAPLADLLRTLAADAPADGLDAIQARDLLFSLRVQPCLGHAGWQAVVDWPADAAAQARIRPGPPATAARFEVFRSGVELANGYWELTDATELSARLAQEQGSRGVGAPARDQRFEDCIAHLPASAGVAVGFDRVVALALGLDGLAAAQAFADA